MLGSSLVKIKRLARQAPKLAIFWCWNGKKNIYLLACIVFFLLLLHLLGVWHCKLQTCWVLISVIITAAPAQLSKCNTAVQCVTAVVPVHTRKQRERKKKKKNLHNVAFILAHSSCLAVKLHSSRSNKGLNESITLFFFLKSLLILFMFIFIFILRVTT